MARREDRLVPASELLVGSTIKWNAKAKMTDVKSVKRTPDGDVVIQGSYETRTYHPDEYVLVCLVEG